MKVSYYPGCTLKSNAKNFEESALCALKALGLEVTELDRWNCCGTVYSLATDDLIHHLASIRNLIRVKEAQTDTVMTLCAMCYNTLKRVNDRVKADPESLAKVHKFMDEEKVAYAGDVKVRLGAGSFAVVGVRSPSSVMSPDSGVYGEMPKLWTGADARGFSAISAVPARLYRQAGDAGGKKEVPATRTDAEPGKKNGPKTKGP